MKKQKHEPTTDSKIKTYLDMIAPSVIKFNTDHYICGNTFRCIYALREYPTSTSEQAMIPASIMIILKLSKSE